MSGVDGTPPADGPARYRMADANDSDRDMVTGEVLAPPSAEWLLANQVKPYWLAAFPFQEFTELYETQEDADGGELIPEAITDRIEYVGMEFRYVDGDGQAKRIVVSVGADTALALADLIVKQVMSRG